jgi:IPT/TIG domain
MFAAGETPTDVAISADGTMFASASGGETQVRDASLAMIASRAAPEREQIPSATFVPVMALHPSGALVYQPFLNGPAPPESSTVPIPASLRGGIDIFDAHCGRLRLRIFLPEPLAAHATDTDALHAQFLAVDETGQRIFALTTSGLTVVQLASAPLSIGTVSPSNAPAAGGSTITIRGSGLQTGTTATIGGKKAAVTFKDSSTITLVTPTLSQGPQQVVVTNPNGESFALDAAFTAN